VIERLKSLMDNIKWVAEALVGAVLVALLTVLLLVPQSITDFVSDVSLPLRLLVVILIYAVAAYVLYRQYQYPAVKGLVVRSSGTLATLNTESARDAIVKAVRDIDGVRAVRADVKPGRRGWAQIELRVAVQGDNISLPDKEQEINRALIQVAEKRLGLSLAKRPLVLITFGESEAALDAIKSPDEADIAEPRTEVVAPPASADEPADKPAAEAEPEAEAEKSGGLMGRFFRHDEDTEDVVTKSDVQPSEPKSEPQADALETDEFYSFLKSTVPAPADEPADESDEQTSPKQPASTEPETEAETDDGPVLEDSAADEEPSDDDAPLPPTVEPEAVAPPTAPAPTSDDDDDSATWIVDEHITGPEPDEDEPEEKNGPRRLE